MSCGKGGISVGVAVGGWLLCPLLDGGRGVAVGGSAVGGMGVAVGGMGVSVGTGVRVGIVPVSGVAVGSSTITGVGVGVMPSVSAEML